MDVIITCAVGLVVGIAVVILFCKLFDEKENK